MRKRLHSSQMTVTFNTTANAAARNDGLGSVVYRLERRSDAAPVCRGLSAAPVSMTGHRPIHSDTLRRKRGLSLLGCLQDPGDNVIVTMSGHTSVTTLPVLSKEVGESGAVKRLAAT
eukprot:GHVU01169695.1.p2 GENE.GHVU01169695.1~~GHVU01169695.1.p2  ORF type:complete len:117 (-),score=8.19 GHVU01169695.1:117-467(-)